MYINYELQPATDTQGKPLFFQKRTKRSKEIYSCFVSIFFFDSDTH